MKSISGVLAAILIVTGYAIFGSILSSVLTVVAKTLLPEEVPASGWFNLLMLLFWLYWLVLGFLHAKRTLQ